ncbi:hypothetical protein [Rothia kristinae]|uniref:hypothetical protein n=1 Tax=Rothia kristinae TaxID=37923 RepID=UPI002E2A0484|nr:hypothetical protein [Rothia kristinae]MED6047052.1 hypothetical protein [Rothia kristinae]
MRSHGHLPEASEALLTFVITLLAVFTAGVISTTAVTGRLPDAARQAAVSFGAIDAVSLPIIFLGLGWLGVWDVAAALTGSMIALIAGLAVVARLAVRTTRLPRWQRLLLLGAESVLGLAVIGLEMLAHG